MSKLDYLDLSARSLKLLLVVFEEGSVTRAADRLNISQSAVSHMLDKLRIITDDPLFVRAGRSIVATDRAEQLVRQIRPLLLSLQQLTVIPEFDPSKLGGTFSIGAAAMQRDLLLPPIVRQIRKQAPKLDLKIINSGIYGAQLLRKGHCDLLISPAPPQGEEFIKKKLFDDDWVCFFDPSTPSPRTLQQYISRDHVKVVFSNDERSVIDVALAKLGKERRVALRVESFSALPSMMQGTDLIIALPKIIERSLMKGFSSCPLPLHIPALGFYLAWHLSKDLSPPHQWVRNMFIQS